MKKRILSSLLAVAMLISVIVVGFTGCGTSEGGEMTIVGTPRAETLIVEVQSPTDVPGQFNSHVTSTANGFGIHQLLWNNLWEMDTTTGEQFGDIASGMPVQNEDFTTHTISIREGLKWSDGEALDANDVVYTMNAIKDNENHRAWGTYNEFIESVELIDDLTLMVTTTIPQPKFTQTFGVTVWGNDLRIVPEHIYKDQDISTFVDSDPVVSGPYTVNKYDENGNWVLFDRREDWEASPSGQVTGKMPAAKYILFQSFTSSETRQLAMVNNDVDVMVEVTPEDYENIIKQNDKVSAWYDEFPYATSNDPRSKGLSFSSAQGAPYDNPDFRWAITLALNFDEISLNVFDGIGRASPFGLLTATDAMTDVYYEPLLSWVEEFELDLGDGTTLKPFDTGYAMRMVETLNAEPHNRNLPTDEESAKDMFGLGWWKHDPEAAEKLLIKAGLTKEADGWYFEGEPFTMNMTRLAETEPQAGRGTEAAYNQLLEFGLNVTFSQDSQTAFTTNGKTGEYELSGYWPTLGGLADLYSEVRSHHTNLITPLGESGSGADDRWSSAELDALIDELAVLPPDDERVVEIGMEIIKLSIIEMPFIGFHSGVKLVPTNNTYFTNYPTAENPYDGPWWWWSTFKYAMHEFEAVGDTTESTAESEAESTSESTAE